MFECYDTFTLGSTGPDFEDRVCQCEQGLTLKAGVPPQVIGLPGCVLVCACMLDCAFRHVKQSTLPHFQFRRPRHLVCLERLKRKGVFYHFGQSSMYLVSGNNMYYNPRHSSADLDAAYSAGYM